MSNETSLQLAKRMKAQESAERADSNNMAQARSASIVRKTNETDIKVTLCLDEDVDVAQSINISTGIGFLDHVWVVAQLLNSKSTDVWILLRCFTH